MVLFDSARPAAGPVCETLLRNRRNHHEDHDQNQQDVDQWRDVDVGLGNGHATLHFLLASHA
jgi:hypothetical protein